MAEVLIRLVIFHVTAVSIASAQTDRCRTRDGELDESCSSLHWESQSHLLQKRKDVADIEKVTALLEDAEVAADDSTYPIWDASAFHDCTTLPSCGGASYQLRDVKCLDHFSGKELGDDKCAALPKPIAKKDCSCDAMACSVADPSVACPADAGSNQHVHDGDKAAFGKVGCFSVEGLSLGEAQKRDLTCMKHNSSDQCRAGLAFYSKSTESSAACINYCVGKGLDVSGFVSNTKLCLCGASVLNDEVWHKGSPRPGLAFHPESLKAANVPGDKNCPLMVQRYVAELDDGGVLPEYMTFFEEKDIEYTDSVAMGRQITEEEEEDGGEEPQPAMLQQQHDEPEPIDSFHRHCFPGNCDSGTGDWLDRVYETPPGRKDEWWEYTVIDYQFASDTDDSRKEAFRAATLMWNAATCIHLREVTKAPGRYLEAGVFSGQGCVTNGRGWPAPPELSRQITLGWCNSMRHKGNMAHEIGHALGMNHEQKRPDATVNYHGHGPYLNMHWENIPSEWVGQYTPDYTSYTGSTNDGPMDPHVGYAPYDFDSIMHYGHDASFDTVTPKDNGEVGQRVKLSDLDIQHILDNYQCKRKTGDSTRPPTPPPTSVFECDFDTNYCNWFFTSDDTRWRRRSDSTPTSRTGPATDHGGQGQYVYVEASSNNPSKSFQLQAKAPAPLPQNELLSFWYNMYGRNMGDLEVRAQVASAWNSIWSMKGDQGEDWQKGWVEVPAGTTDLMFHFTTGDGIRSDIAIDDIKTEQGTRPPTPQPTSVFNCNFDESLCSWSYNDGLRWRQRSDATPTSRTGPTTDHSGQGQYAYVEASNNVPAKSFQLEATSAPMAQTQTLSFWYHMYGENMGELEVQTQAGSVWNSAWKKAGDKTDQWLQGRVELPAGTTGVRFHATTGDEFRSDIAIDDIEVQ